MRTLLLLLLLLPLHARGADFVFTNDYHLAPGQQLDAETWLASVNADIEGRVNADFFAMGTSNTLGGVVSQDAWLLGDSARLTGRVDDDARLLCRRVQVQGTVGGNLLALGETLQLAETGTVQGSLHFVGVDLFSRGHVKGDVRLQGQKVTLGGDVGGNAYLWGNDLAVMKDTRVAGDLHYRSDRELFLDDSVAVGGKLIHDPAPAPALASPGQVLIRQGSLLLAALLVGLPFVTLFSGYTGRAVRAARQAPWKCALVGLVAFSLLPAAGVLAVFSVIGLPLGLLLLAAFGTLVYLSKVVVALVIGALVLRRQGPQPLGFVLAALVVGLLILYPLNMIPGLRGTIWLVIALTGMGALVLALLPQKTPVPPVNKPPAPPPETFSTEPPAPTA